VKLGLTVREQVRMRVFENNVPRRIIGPKRGDNRKIMKIT
jgi:hypothetical protein